jgi:DNA polymerase III subunit alpha
MSFVGLHIHSDYSLLDGASQIPQMIDCGVMLVVIYHFKLVLIGR